MNGTEVARQIRARVPKSEILIFTMHDNETWSRRLLRAALGIPAQVGRKALLIEAIASLASHRPFFTPKVSETLLGAFVAGPEPKKSSLSSRERRVVQLIAEGHTNKEIASILNLSVKTVETHRAAIMRKLRVHSSADCRPLRGPQQDHGGVNHGSSDLRSAAPELEDRCGTRKGLMLA